MTADQPLTWHDLTDDELDFLLKYRSLPPHRQPVLDLMIKRVRDGMPFEEAKRLADQEIAAADAKHATAERMH